MRIGHIVPMLAKRYLNPAVRNRAVFLKGKSGIGKSQAVQQAAELLAQHVEGWQGVIDLRLSQMDPTDLRGIPVPNGDRTQWLAPDFFPKEDTSGILFLDEITSAPPAIQAAAYQLILDRAIGSYHLPEGWMVVAAGNLQSDRGVTFQIAAPLLNRMCEVEVTTVLDDWLMHANSRGVSPEVLSFIKDRPDMLHKFEGKGAIEPFPSPRSWFALNDTMSLDLPQADRVELFKGDVGSEAAVAFEAHLRLWEQLPSLDAILKGEDIDVPSEINLRYCIAMGLAARLSGTNMDKAWGFIEKMPKELQTLIVKMAFKRDKTVAKAAAFVKFAANNQAAFSRV